MTKVRADEVAIFKRKKRFRRELDKPLADKVRELERRIAELEKKVCRE